MKSVLLAAVLGSYLAAQVSTRLTKEQVNIVLRAQRLPVGGRFDDLRFDDGSPYAKTDGQ